MVGYPVVEDYMGLGYGGIGLNKNGDKIHRDKHGDEGSGWPDELHKRYVERWNFKIEMQKKYED